MKEINFSIINWSAWTPGLDNKKDWQDWANNQKCISTDKLMSPIIDFIPQIQRRRLSQLTKMSLKTAFECSEGYNNIESVFASRYGELSQTLKLLKSIFNKEDLSPAGFSLSVHNTAAGLYSVIDKNTKPYTAIAAGEITFEAAFLEALGRLQYQEYILLVVSEEYVTEMQDKLMPLFSPFSTAFLLGKIGKVKINATIGETRNIPAYSKQDISFSFLKWLISNQINEKNEKFSTRLISFEKIKND